RPGGATWLVKKADGKGRLPPADSTQCPAGLAKQCYSVSFEINTGGAGGIFASVRAAGVQQPPAIKVSAEETSRGGADGSFNSWGGGTKPGSLLPSPAANAVPTHRVIVNAGTMYFIVISLKATARA
ncbi:MAG: hypothetical protein NTV49_14550, partial [Kiritimatiellaeota bacterium]|nr:hypothetical protein [Kiritimatiellota bacterium]